MWLEVVQILCVDKVEATAQQLRLQQKGFGLLPDLGEGFLNFHGIVTIHAADDELCCFWAVMLASYPPEPDASRECQSHDSNAEIEQATSLNMQI